MITSIERAELDRIREHEADFYAELLFLALFRRAHTSGQREDIKQEVAREIADTVLGVYADINTRTMEPDDT